MLYNSNKRSVFVYEFLHYYTVVEVKYTVRYRINFNFCCLDS